MGSATRHALAAATAVISEAGAVELSAAEELFSVARLLESHQQIRSALADPAAQPSAKTGLIGRLFGDELGGQAARVLETAVTQRWSDQADIVAGIEELGIRLAAEAATDASLVQSELYAFAGAVASDAQLELALGSKLGLQAAKEALVRSLLEEKATPATLAIVLQVVLHPRGRSVRAALNAVTALVADQGGRSVATVTVATAVPPGRIGVLAERLSARFGREVSVNQVVDPAVLGGMRVRIGDQVIDGTIATRLADLRQRLAG